MILVARHDHHCHLLSSDDINGSTRILSDAKADLRIPSNTVELRYHHCVVLATAAAQPALCVVVLAYGDRALCKHHLTWI